MDRQQTMKVCAVDLDGTLLHPDPAEIAVIGSSGYRYMSRRTAELLEILSQRIPIIIATGRNARSVARLVDQLGRVNFSGFILENGMIRRKQLIPAMPHQHPWNQFMDRLPGWQRLDGYEKCLGIRVPPDVQFPEKIIRNLLEQSGQTGVLYQEPQKIFIYPWQPDKFAGIQWLGFELLIALGDGINDVEMLRGATHAAVPGSAETIAKQCAKRKGGYCSPFSSHAGAQDLLTWAIGVADNVMNRRKQ